METPHFALYKESNSGVTKDGHTMIDPDIARELNRKSFLEENKLNQEKEISELKAHVSELRNQLVYFVSDNFEFNEDSEYLHGEIEGLLEQTPAQSLAEIQSKAMKQGYWQGFETSRCMPDEHNILMFWTEYENKLRSEA